MKAGRKKPRTSGARWLMRRETRATNLSCPHREFARVRRLFADFLNPLLGSRFVQGLCFFQAVEGDDDNRVGGVPSTLGFCRCDDVSAAKGVR